MSKNLQTEVAELAAKVKLKKNLPHLYGYKLYPWMREFFESTNRVNLICSANQIGKSSVQIRKAIHWATAKELWPTLWTMRPLVFWYLYPTKEVATIEFKKKWVEEYLPRNEAINHEQYGWKPEYRNGYITACHFNSRISIYFKTYAQDPQDLQTGTVFSIFNDEELPEDLYPELQMRLAATDGYFNAVFTPTLGQEFWREALEVKGSRERFKGALKIQVSMYDCLKYEDGSSSHWTEERIERIKNACKNDAEIQRRVYGRFVLDSGLKYPSFHRDKNLKEPIPVPKDYRVFVGVDSGSGGDNHPSAVVFVAVSPDYKKGIVFKGQRFDNMVMTNSDLVHAVQEMKADVENVDAVFYDHAAVDLREISARMGESWVTAEKSHLIGEQVLNVLFKNSMLDIFYTDELEPLAVELSCLKKATPKNMAKDDYCDALRYAVTKIPWDWSAIKGEKLVVPKTLSDKDLRRAHVINEPRPISYDISEEIDAWNELYDVY